MTHFNWSPGIGDPTVAGWLTVILYLVTSVGCWILARGLGSADIERRAWRGTTLVTGYVLIRAASFHHVDRFIGRTILGFRWNWILEMGGIALVLFASQWRQIHPVE